VTLLAFAAEHRAAAQLLLGAGRAAINRYLLPAGRTAANPPQWRANDGRDGQTDRGTLDSFIHPALHTMQAVKNK